jgi:predicted ATPase
VLNQDPGLDLPAAACELGTAAAPQQAGPRQLPSSVADFVGRSRHLAEIKRILLARQESEDARYAVPIVAISGPGGVGKSTLALRAAHELRADFPDEHLYVDLSGPVSDDHTTILLARFLRALGVSGSMIPDERAERAELYRSRLASKRLLLLDDVHSEQQVMPLLPGSPSCAVIVTSRIPKQQQTGTASRRKAPARPEPGHRR